MFELRPGSNQGPDVLREPEPVRLQQLPAFGVGVTCECCNKPATLMSHVHGCLDSYLCDSCWESWYSDFSDLLRKARDPYGNLICAWCRRRFGTVEDFSEYEAIA